jgi:hypothetical protein
LVRDIAPLVSYSAIQQIADHVTHPEIPMVNQNV